MNYSNKLAWKRYTRLRREFKLAVQEKKWEEMGRAQHRLDSFILTHLLLNECRQKQGIGTTKG